jgi:hypothetical protein
MSDASDRRRSPRVAVQGRVHGSTSGDVQILVLEMSLGGMSIETPTALPVGEVTDFLLTLGDGAGIEVYGRTVYTKPIDGSAGPRFLSGIQFVDHDDATPPVEGLISNL